MIKGCRYLYNLTPATTLIKDQCPIGERFYGEGDVLKLPMWFSKRLQKQNIAEIQEIKEFGNHFNQAITNQSVNRKQIVKIDRDFYFMAIDYLYLYVTKRKARFEKKEQFTKFYNLRKNIMLSLLPMGYNPKLVMNMALTERLAYVKMIQTLKNMDRYVNPLVSKGMYEEEEESEK